MNLQFYFEKLTSSKEFKEFMEKNPKAYLCSGFFTIDKNPKSSDNQIHFDYYIPKEKKMFSFQLEEGIKVVPLENFDKDSIKISVPEIDFDEIENLIVKEMEKNQIKNKIQKIILSLQNVDGKISLVGTIFISMLGMLRVQIDLKEKKITEFEKKSIFDILKVRRKKDSKPSEQ